MEFTVVEKDDYGGKEHGFFHMDMIPRIGETVMMNSYSFIVEDVCYKLDYGEVVINVKRK